MRFKRAWKDDEGKTKFQVVSKDLVERVYQQTYIVDQDFARKAIESRLIGETWETKDAIYKRVS